MAIFQVVRDKFCCSWMEAETSETEKLKKPKLSTWLHIVSEVNDLSHLSELTLKLLL